MTKYEFNKLSLAHVEMGEFLKKARTKAGYSQADVAKILGYSNSQFISNIERNTAPIPMDALVKLAEAYDIPWSQIVKILTRSYQAHLEQAYKKSKTKKS